MSKKSHLYLLSLIFILFVSEIGLGTIGVQPTIVKSEDGPSPGQQVINFYRDVFENDWAIGRPYNESEGMGLAASRTLSGSPSFVRKEAKTISEEMKITPILSPDNSEALIIDLINRANSSLMLMQMYFNPGLDGIKNAIKNARTSRNVNVSFIIEADASNTNATAVELVSAGVVIRTFDGTAPLYMDEQHNKGIIVDGKIVLVCSINWSPTSVKNNREAGLIIENEQVAQYYTQLFLNDWNGCKPFNQSSSFSSSYSEPGVSPLPAGTDYELQPPLASQYVKKYETKQTFSGKMDVKALASPDNCHEALVEEILKANRTIDVSVYTFSNPYIMDALADRIAAGVKVRLLLGRPLGSYELNYNRWSMVNFTIAGIPAKSDPSRNLTAQGKWNSADFTYQHCKYAIFDNKTLIISSGNWSPGSCPKPRTDGTVRGNRDWWFIIYGDGIDNAPQEEEFIDGYSNFLISFAITTLSLMYVVLKRRVHITTQ